MVKILSSQTNILVYGKKFHVLDINAKYLVIDLIQNASLPRGNNNLTIDTLEISPCKQFLAATVYKTLFLFSNVDYGLLKSCHIEKTALFLRFFNSIKYLLIGDRSGMVTLFTYDKDLNVLEATLGHNSQITDVLIAPSDKYIITADRDEKIRVTCYPNVYNILTYCLGHNQFVSSLCFVPNNKNQILSASGDCTLRLWDYIDGKELAQYKARETTPYAKVVVGSITGESLIVALHHASTEVEVLYLSGDIKTVISFNLKTIVSVGKNIIDLIPYGSSIIALCDDEKKPFYIWPDTNPETFNPPESILAGEVLKSEKTFEIFHKRNFDNVGEYYKKKKARLLVNKT